MLRCTIEMIPFGNEKAARPLGIVEIGNDATGDISTGNYIITLKKSPPWKGALKDKWKSARLQLIKEDSDVIMGKVEGFDRQKIGPYDLLYRALKACGLDKRND
jgi:hypothetical protein